jgi:hypothetical protein
MIATGDDPTLSLELKSRPRRGAPTVAKNPLSTAESIGG